MRKFKNVPKLTNPQKRAIRKAHKTQKARRKQGAGVKRKAAR